VRRKRLRSEGRDARPRLALARGRSGCAGSNEGVTPRGDGGLDILGRDLAVTLQAALQQIGLDQERAKLSSGGLSPIDGDYENQAMIVGLRYKLGY
jgi:hypothetical protein